MKSASQSLPEAIVKRFSLSNRSLLDEFNIGLRPEAFRPPEQNEAGQQLQARVIAVEAMGHEQIVYFVAGAPPLGAGVTESKAVSSPLGDSNFHENTFSARLPSHYRAVPGEPISLAVDLAHAHFFDAQGKVLG